MTPLRLDKEIDVPFACFITGNYATFFFLIYVFCCFHEQGYDVIELRAVTLSSDSNAKSFTGFLRKGGNINIYLKYRGLCLTL